MVVHQLTADQTKDAAAILAEPEPVVGRSIETIMKHGSRCNCAVCRWVDELEELEIKLGLLTK